MRKLLELSDKKLVTCSQPILCKKGINKLYPSFKINQNWWCWASLYDHNTSSTYPREVHVECLFYWMDTQDRKRALIGNQSIHVRPVYWISRSPLHFITSLPTFIQFFDLVQKKKKLYNYIIDDQVQNIVENLHAKVDALFSEKSKAESWVEVFSKFGYYELLQTRYEITDLIFDISESCLLNMINLITDWETVKLAETGLRSEAIEIIEDLKETHFKRVSNQLENIKGKRSENIDQFLDSIHSVVNLFSNITLEKNIWRKINDLHLDLLDRKTRKYENENERGSLEYEIIEMIFNALSNIENNSAIKDHLRSSNKTTQEDHFRDYLKNYFDDRKGYRAESEYVTKIDGLSDIKLKKQNQRYTISVKIWNRNFDTHPPIEQLIDDMGPNERIGFLLMVSNLKKENIYGKHVKRFLDNHVLYEKNSKVELVKENDISHISALYKKNEIIFKINHILFETKQFLKKR